MGAESSDTVRVRFVVEGGQDIATALQNQDQALDTMSRKFIRLNEYVKKTREFIRELGNSEDTSILTQQLLKAESQANNLATEIRRVKTELSQLPEVASRIQYGLQGPLPQNGLDFQRQLKESAVLLDTQASAAKRLEDNTSRLPVNFGSARAQVELFNQSLAEMDNRARQVIIDLEQIRQVDLNNQIRTIEAQRNSRSNAGFILSKDIEGPDAIQRQSLAYKNLSTELENVIRQVERLHQQEVAAAFGDPITRQRNAFTGQAPLGGQFNIAPNVQDTRLLNNFNSAAREINKTEDAVAGVNKQVVSLSGTTLIGTTILRELGVEGARGIEVMSRSIIMLKEQGVSLQDVLSSKLLGFTLLGAAAILLIKEIDQVTGSIRAFEETYLRTAERTNKVSLIGQTGGTSQLQTDLKRLQDARRDIEYYLGAGNNRDRAADVAREIGGGGSREEILRLQSELQKAIKEAKDFRFGNLFYFTSDQGDKEKKIRDLYEQLGTARGSFASPDLIAKRTKEATAEFDQFQLSLKAKGDLNIFEETEEKLRSLAATTRRTADLKEFIKGLEDQASRGGLSLEGLTKQVKRFKESLEETHEQQERLTKLNERLREQFAKVNQELKLRDQATKEVYNLEKQLVSDNPLEKALEAAIRRSEQFRERFSSLPEYIYDRMKSASDRLLELELFKGNLAEKIGLGNIGKDIDKIQSGLFGNDEDRSEAARQRTVDARIQEALRSGNLDDLRAAQAASGPSGRVGELEEKERQARIRGEFVKASELENQRLEESRRLSTRDFERRALDSQLDVLKGALGQARTAQQQRFTLDQIIQLTSNLGQLKPEEQDFRLRALQQRLALGEGERARVQIEIRNQIPDLVKTTIEDALGPEPSPSGISSYGSSPRYSQSGAFDPLGGGQ